MGAKKLTDMTTNELMDFCIKHNCDDCPLYSKVCNESQDVYGVFFNKNIDEIELEIKTEEREK